MRGGQSCLSHEGQELSSQEMQEEARKSCRLMQAYVGSQSASLQPRQPTGPAEEGTTAADVGPQEPSDEGSNKAQAQKLRREVLSQLLSKVQSSAALLVEPLLDAGGAMSRLSTHFCFISICRRVAASPRMLLVSPDSYVRGEVLCCIEVQ